ncbi:MAG: hypothetical protein V4719_08220 [Planctomycetota bacterium]
MTNFAIIAGEAFVAPANEGVKKSKKLKGTKKTKKSRESEVGKENKEFKGALAGKNTSSIVPCEAYL